MGCFRFVCSNGLIIGVTRSDMRRRHVGDFQIGDIGKVLTSGLKATAAIKASVPAEIPNLRISMNLAKRLSAPIRAG